MSQRPIRTRMLLLFIRLLSWLPLPVIRWLGRGAGHLMSVLDIDPTRTTRRNIDLCYPGLSVPERKRLVRESLGHTACVALESGMLWHWPIARCEAAWTRVEGDYLVDEALQTERGVLMLVPHFGNWEVLALYLGRWGYTCLYDRPRLPGLEEPMLAARSRTGGELLPIGPAAIKGVLRALRSGRMVVLLPDQVPEGQGGVHAPFFGRPALTMTLAQRLLLQTGAIPLLGSATREQTGFTIRFESITEPVGDVDPETAAAALNRVTESLIQEQPAQYQWEYRRYKRPPSGAAPVYTRNRKPSRRRR